jgi:replicative DNA helicase
MPAGHLWDLLVISDDSIKQVIESERQMLAAAIRRKEDYVLISSRISADDALWVIGQHHTIWRSLASLYEEGVEKITDDVASRLPNVMPEFINNVLMRNGNNLDWHIGQVIDAFSRRSIQTSAKKLSAAVSNKTLATSDIVSDHLAQISMQLSPNLKSEFTATEQVDLAMDYVHERMQSGAEMPGVNMGVRWKGLMQSILGFQDSYMYLLAASPKAGKTSLAQNWALISAVVNKVPTLWINLEMSERDLALRNLSILSGVSCTRVRMGAITDREKKILDDAAIRYYESPLFVANGAGLSVQEIVNLMRKYVHAHGVKIIFLDYIQLIKIKNAKGMEYWESHMEISTVLKTAVSRDLKVPLIAVSQLNRFAAQEGTSSGATIGGSYKYIQDTDCYLGLRNRTLKEMDDGQPGNVVLNIEYNRHGPQDVQIRLNFNRDSLRMEEAT